MNRLWLTWALFLGCCAVVLAAMGWITAAVLRLEGAQVEAQRQAVREENVRLALWRMDSSLAPLLAQEASRPYFQYRAFYPAEQAYSRMLNAQNAPTDVMINSPLLSFRVPQIVLHFQVAPGGRVTSPQVPTSDALRDLAERTHVTPQQIAESRDRLRKFAASVTLEQLESALPVELPAVASTAADPPALAQQPAPEPGETLRVAREETNYQAEVNNGTWGYSTHEQTQTTTSVKQQRRSLENTVEQQAAVSSYEFDVRLKKAQDYFQQQLEANRLAPKSGVVEGAMRPVRIGPSLLLARRVRVGSGNYIQGCWLDWPAIQQWLLDDVKDLLPDAKLELLVDEIGEPGALPVAAGARRSHLLASLPVQLIPGEPSIDPAPGLSPLRVSLLIAWGAVTIAALATAGLLAAAVRLSERRASFVSAVTHELRTPLTTFRLYTDMLSEGRIGDEAKRQTYVETLRGEAERLSHLVENMLAHARLERGRTRSQVETIELGRIVERVRDRLARRAEQAGMELVVEMRDNVAGTRVRADMLSLEQVLLNLVDNACKYAAPGPEDPTDDESKRIHLQADVQGGAVFLRVFDHGPGIGPDQAKRLFRAFSKSAHEAANTKPGVGLGLALSRRLARGMGGDLKLDPSPTRGASFVVTLPLG